MRSTVEMPQTWTFDDLQALPEDADWRRYEIVDGALVVSPPPGFEHEFVISDLRAVLHAQLPGTLTTLSTIGIDLGTSYRVPDLLVVRRAVRASGRKLALPSDVLLVVEVVSPGSQTTDRITKPVQYAQAGIGAFWRVETDPVSLTAYTLPPGAATYAEVGRWHAGEVARIPAPFPVEIDLKALTAPH